jgi:hypothetical protein
VNQILEFCGPWNERKSQSILMNMQSSFARNGSLYLPFYGKFRQNHDKFSQPMLTHGWVILYQRLRIGHHHYHHLQEELVVLWHK